MMELNKKTAIVTGCSKGIGLATVHALLEKGVTVAGWSRTAPEIDHPRFRYYPTDVSDVKSVQTSFKATTGDIGININILVNNAGIGYSGNIEEMSVNEWEQMFAINVNGLFYCSQLVIPEMKRRGEGHIFNIASIAGKDGTPQLAGYCGSKFAVRGISQAMYKELRDYGVKVTCISPGSVLTSFFDRMATGTAPENMMKAEEVASSIVYCLETSANFHPVELELRPLMPKGKKTIS